MLARALGRARWTIFWERLWPALASLATAVGLFLALSWLGLWLWLPPLGRAVGLWRLLPAHRRGLVPLFLVRLPTGTTVCGASIGNAGLPHRPATAIADELAAECQRSHSRSRCGARMSERALRGREALKAGTAGAACCQRVIRLRCGRWCWCWWSRRSSPPAASGSSASPRRSIGTASWRRPISASMPGCTPPTYTGRPPLILPGLRPGEPVQAAAALRRAGRQHAGRPRDRRPARRRRQRRGQRCETGRAERSRQRDRDRTNTVRARAPRSAASPSPMPARSACAASHAATSAGGSPPSRISRRRSRSPRTRKARHAALCSSATRSKTTMASSARRRSSSCVKSLGTNGKRAASLFAPPDLPLALPQARTQTRRRPDHQGSDRASLGRRRRGDDADRARRGRQ